jgi:hypothetical protein
VRRRKLKRHIASSRTSPVKGEWTPMGSGRSCKNGLIRQQG